MFGGFWWLLVVFGCAQAHRSPRRPGATLNQIHAFQACTLYINHMSEVVDLAVALLCLAFLVSLASDAISVRMWDCAYFQIWIGLNGINGITIATVFIRQGN